LLFCRDLKKDEFDIKFLRRFFGAASVVPREAFCLPRGKTGAATKLLPIQVAIPLHAAEKKHAPALVNSDGDSMSERIVTGERKTSSFMGGTFGKHSGKRKFDGKNCDCIIENKTIFTPSTYSLK
jgi:hypothetical protein